MEQGYEEERMVEKAGILLVPIVRDALAKANRRDQEQSGGEQIPRTRKKIRGVRDRRGGRGKKTRAPHVGSKGPHPPHRRGFPSPPPPPWAGTPQNQRQQTKGPKPPPA